MDRVIEVWKQWDAVAKEGRPDSVYVDNLGGGIHTVKDMWRIGQTAGWFNADHEGPLGQHANLGLFAAGARRPPS